MPPTTIVLTGRATGGGWASSPRPHPDVASRAVASGSRRPRLATGDLVMVPALLFTVLDPFISGFGWLVI
jgi:hypothetical protein